MTKEKTERRKMWFVVNDLFFFLQDMIMKQRQDCSNKRKEVEEENREKRVKVSNVKRRKQGKSQRFKKPDYFILSYFQCRFGHGLRKEQLTRKKRIFMNVI